MDVEYSNVTGRRLQPFKPGKERNPKTNRCRKPLPPCKKGSMRNPKANRGKKIPKGPDGEVWCDLSQLEARRLILRVGLGRDLVPGDLPTHAGQEAVQPVPDVVENAKRFLHERLESDQVYRGRQLIPATSFAL